MRTVQKMRGIRIALGLVAQGMPDFQAVQKSARPLEGRMGDRAGSSPASDTKTVILKDVGFYPRPLFF